MITLTDIIQQSLADVVETLAETDDRDGWQFSQKPDICLETQITSLKKVYGEFRLVVKLALASYFLSFLVLFFHKKGPVRPKDMLDDDQLARLLTSLSVIFLKEDRYYQTSAQSGPAATIDFLNHWLTGNTPFSAGQAKDSMILALLIRHDQLQQTRLSSRVMNDIRYLVYSLAMQEKNLSSNEKELLDLLERETEKIKVLIGDDSSISLEKYAESLEKQQTTKVLEEARTELEELIGLQSIKLEINRLEAFLKIQKKREALGLAVTDVTLHFVFNGNPGTGKTTVARILGKLFKGLGFLQKGHVVETDRSGLVAEYLGQTAVKTRTKAESALDGILFIDEAYALSRSSTGGRETDNYGQEAIETMLKFMEDNRKRLVVVVAGYPQLMADFIDTNPGLKSRFTRYLTFEDFQPVELCRIIQLLAAKAQYCFEAKTLSTVGHIFAEAFAQRTEGFGNARFVRNLFEEMVQNQAMRLSKGKNELAKEALMAIEKEDVPTKIDGVDFSNINWSLELPLCSECTDPPSICPSKKNKEGSQYTFNNMSIDDWCKNYPLLSDLIAYRETIWFNPKGVNDDHSPTENCPTSKDIDQAADRLDRFAPFITKVFPETRSDNGLIESPLRPIPTMQQVLEKHTGQTLKGRLLLKCDNLLPISGSIKARGGIYAVFKYAETIALADGLLKREDDYAMLAEEKARKLFGNHRIAVGSTGNLGLSIGIIGACFGFRVTVHMSADARQWKKDLLRKQGVEVIEHQGDYSQAVAAGREQSALDPQCFFIDDENSIDLFLGYAVAARRLQVQLAELSVQIDDNHPLYVYLPCGVGGGPGGITFGLKQIYGDHVYCFLAEPTHSPCMLLGMYTGLHEKVSIKDFGLDNKTAADGLAVSRPSGLVGKIMEPLLDGIFTVDDQEMYRLLALLADTEYIRMEPSALAGMPGIARVGCSPFFLQKHGLSEKMANATHIVWGTGGNMIPDNEMDEYYRKGTILLSAQDSSQTL
jgi:D-serine dehydratase